MWTDEMNILRRGDCMMMDGWQTEYFEKANELLNKRYKNQKITIKEYSSTPEVLIDGKVFVDREVFKGYIINLLEQERKHGYLEEDEKIGLEIAINIVENVQ